MKFKVGDKVKVKTWDALAEGNNVCVVSENPDFNCQKVIEKGNGFVHPTMSYFCGKEVTIIQLDPYGEGGYYIEEYEGDEDVTWEDWMFEEGETP